MHSGRLEAEQARLAEAHNMLVARRVYIGSRAL